MSFITSTTPSLNQHPSTGVVSTTLLVNPEKDKVATQAHTFFADIPAGGFNICGWGISVDVRISAGATVGVIVDLLLPRAGAQTSEWYLSNPDDSWHPSVDPARAVHLARGIKIFNPLISGTLLDAVEWSGAVAQQRVCNAVMVVRLLHDLYTDDSLWAPVRVRGLLYTTEPDI